MKKLKHLFTTLLLLCCVLFADGQSEVTVVEYNGTVSTIVVTEQGRIYFSSDRMYVDAGNGSVTDFEVSGIRKMTFNTVTAVSDYTGNAGMMLYPNPATSFFKIAAKEAETLHVQLYTLTGQLLIDSYCQSDDVVSVSDLKSGIYFVKVKGVIFKLLKK